MIRCGCIRRSSASSRAGVVVGSLHHLDAETRHGITIDLMSQETIESSAIEGEALDRASVSRRSPASSALPLTHVDPAPPKPARRN
ncbi:DUF4172 domain-containing protein [Sphingomonas sp. GC_Shp_1]|uniref:DUF4172 domain-containing protein n=1 Tax=unclassified Sphingomonas TaxID=196159 RepID=UPI0031F9C54B